MFKSLLAMILKNEENLITLITILDVDKRNRRKWGVINWRLQQLGIQCRAHFWIDISWNESIFCRVAFMTNCLLNLFCLISIWSWTKHWIDHWISGTLEYTQFCVASSEKTVHNKQNLTVVVAAEAGKILRGTLKSRHAENFQECHLSLMWVFLNYPGSINRSQLLSRA